MLKNSTDESQGPVAPPCVMVIFGATGDLTRRLLLPSLSHLCKHGLLPPTFSIVGVGRNESDDATFRKTLYDSVIQFVEDDDARKCAALIVSRVHYLQGEFDDPNTYQALEQLIERLIKQNGASDNRIYYLATPPEFFAKIVKRLGEAKMVSEEAGFWRRVVIEKPFGQDLSSAIQLNKEISSVLDEKQIFRIDHYLGKETVQNLLAFRFSNGIFEPIWNRRYIDHVQITVAEKLGVELRGGYYDTAGALRDMVPNHIFQLLSLIAMEPPYSFDSDPVRDEKAKVLRAVEPISPEDVLTRTVRGQYGAGVISGERVIAYRDELKVAADSSTETYAALKLVIENWRWAGVPFYIRTGKRLPARMTEIAIMFKKAPSIMFRRTQSLSPNVLVIHIQPEEGISLRFGAKIPGPIVRIGDVNMKFNYKDYFGTNTGTGYETLLYECMMGDGTLFQRADMVVSGWKVVEPILEVYKALPPHNFPNYTAGSSGPKEAEDLLLRDNRQWRTIIPG